MPNWCQNAVCLSHKDSAMIDMIVDACSSNKLLNTIIPEPENIDEWYGWRVEHWGTKWEIKDADVLRSEPNEVSLWFDSAWSPPIQVFEALIKKGFIVDARYFESGMCFTGIFTDENGDEFFEITEINSDWIENNIPQELIDTFNLHEWVEMCQEENAEEEG